PGKQLVQTDGDKWAVSGARQGVDQLGSPSIDFSMDARGAVLLGALTEQNVNKKMAVLLDDQVYTAPNLKDAISAQGTITGKFDMAEVEYVVRVLAGGSLQARVSPVPISVNTQAPELGLDNLRLGMRAGIYSLIMCACFLTLYYFYCGLIATAALGINLVLLVGAMALNKAPFTLPGIAGVILSIAMAVDANVLVFERMREEIIAGADLRKAVRLGYEKAMSAIVDGNLTNLIVCFVLGLPAIGTPEVRGFAITMGIGVITTLFSQLVITKLVFDIGTEKFGWRKTSMLPLAVPAVARLFVLNVEWLKYRKIFYAIFAGLVVLSTAVIISRGSKMLGTEFLGGTAITIKTKAGPDGTPVLLDRAEVMERVRKVAEADVAMTDLRNADVLVVNPEAGGTKSNTFTVKTLGKDTQGISDAISRAFEDVMDDRAPVKFRGSDASDASRAPVFAITGPRLGANIDKPSVMNQVPEFVGGVAIVIDGIEPPVSAAQIEERLAGTRGTTAFSDTVGRTTKVLVIEGTEDSATSAVVLVRDPEVSFFGNEAWNTLVRDREWQLTIDSLTKQSTFMNVQSFSGAIARSFTGQAIASILLSTLLIIVYVWVRFNSIRFSIAAIVPTLLDCYIVVGLIALAEIIFDTAPGVARSLGLLPFKIDLTTVASILTILGYSINDKIVVLDRIRENRGKLKHVSAELINASINQTFSRTLMTGTTTILSTLILYLVGGEAVRAFAFAMGLGVIIGTISSIALGAPLVWSRAAEEASEDENTDVAPAAA
ncbi:MAG: protein translocase subunit SecD, partial [bacterium]|nr:protein translocase subunit SecD [bacterium]